MMGWIVATATTAALGVAGAATLGARHHEQSAVWGNDALANAEQAVRVFSGGSQIGISIRDLNDDEVKAGKVTNGVVVEDVEADGPAQKAGFKPGDVVTDYDGERVRSTRQFIRLVQETADGRSVTTAVMRDGQRVPLTVQPRQGGAFKFSNGSLLNGSDDFAFRLAPKIAPPMILKEDSLSPKFDMFVGGASGQLGILVEELTPQLSEYFGAKEGVLVKTVRDNSNASRAGVKAGDVITSVNGGTVSTASDLRRRAQNLESGDEFTLSIVRDKKPMTLKGKVEAQTRRSQPKTIV
jgi:serine protease Do